MNAVAVLRDQVDTLEARLEALSASLATGGPISIPPGLSPQQFDICRYLRRKSPQWVRREAIERFLWGLREQHAAESTVRVQIGRIRCAGVGVESRICAGGGYKMPATAAAAWDLMVTS